MNESWPGQSALLDLLDATRPHGLILRHPREYDGAHVSARSAASSSGYDEMLEMLRTLRFERLKGVAPSVRLFLREG